MGRLHLHWFLLSFFWRKRKINARKWGETGGAFTTVGGLLVLPSPSHDDEKSSRIEGKKEIATCFNTTPTGGGAVARLYREEEIGEAVAN